MRILTLGESPYLLTRDGRIHAEILRSLRHGGFHAEAIVHNHDTSYYLPEEVGSHYFEHGDGQRTRLYPSMGATGSLPGLVIQSLSRGQHNVLLTIGDYAATSFAGYIKASHPSLFKWVSLLTSGSTLINERYRERLLQADKVIVCTRVLLENAKSLGIFEPQLLRFGPDRDAFFDTGSRPNHFKALCMQRCLQSSNLGAFIRAVAISGTNGHIHTNRDDGGEMDMPLLIERHGVCDHLTINQDYVSVREGITQKSLNDLYNRYHAIVDCSLQSGSGLVMLEAMTTGCVPIGVGFGAVGEIIEHMPEPFRFGVGYETFIGPGQEEHAIVKTKELAERLSYLQKKMLEDPRWFAQCSQTAKEVAGIFSKETFSERLNETIANVILSEHAIVVDFY